MKTTTSLLFQWRWAIASVNGPPSASTRHVLLTLAIHMRADGQGAFPSETTLAMETSLSIRAVRKHLKIAAETGWIARKLCRANSKWPQYHYAATIPATVHAPAPHSAASDATPEPDAIGAARDAIGAEPNDHQHRHHVPTNSTGNSTINTTSNTTLATNNIALKKRSTPPKEFADMLKMLQNKMKMPV